MVHLKDIFRQAEGSLITTNAHRINEGKMPQIANKHEGDFFFIDEEDPDNIVKMIQDLVKTRLPQHYGYNPIDDIQVLTPMNKGILGVQNLNTVLQQTLNPSKSSDSLVRYRFHLRDKVMQIRNNYEKEVFNGDMGRIARWDYEREAVVVEFSDKSVSYALDELDELTLGYAITIHKSQGSEYPCVIIPVHTQHYVMLRRNLLYTAITRGKQLLVLIGTKKALGISLSNSRKDFRFTDLKNLV